MTCRPNRILVITGPTSSGKTAFALQIANKIKGEIISADSRQVYAGMDVGTGKEIRKDSKFEIKDPKFNLKGDDYILGYYKISGVRIWGWDIARPDQEFSVSHYAAYAKKCMELIIRAGKNPVICGGTGFYIKSLIDPPKTLDILPNQAFRKEASGYPVSKLQVILAKITPDKLESMNNSDRNNPRRLVRAIEVACFLAHRKSHPETEGGNKEQTYDFKVLGLKFERNKLDLRIGKRVKSRMEKGIIEEIGSLLDRGYGFNLPAFNTIGYKLWRGYFEKGKGSKEEVGKIWEREEIKYSKMQMTYLRRMRQIEWIDADDIGALNNMKKKIVLWYTSF